jgi:putative selenium metabolism protein SsnA
MIKEDRYIIGNGILTDGVEIFFDRGAVLINEGKIVKIGTLEEISEPDLECIDVGGRLILPGLLNAHHHFYSAFSTGIAPLEQPSNFLGILENLWWPWDEALDEETIYYSALVTGMDCLRNGVTTVFDHHASMNCVQGSLDAIASACRELGIRGLLCFETSDRMGSDAVEKHITENVEFYMKHKNNNYIQGCFGLHANITLSDNTLRKIANAIPPEMPIHAHCGEDSTDLEFCKNIGYCGPIHRLDSFGLLDDSSIIAHCIHLSDIDIAIIKDHGLIVANNSESNANNRVGKMKLGEFSYVLGTDGMTSDMVTTLRSHYLLHSEDRIGFEELQKVFFESRYLAQQKFFPTTGNLSPGASADIAVLDYAPLTPINIENLLGHLIFGAKPAKAYITVIEGDIVYREGEFTAIDEEDIQNKAREAAKKQIRRYYG